MKKVFCTLSVLLATSVLVFANAPKAVCLMNSSRKAAIANDAAQKAPAQKTVTINQGDTIYADDFEGDATDWTATATVDGGVIQLGLASYMLGNPEAFSAFSGENFLLSEYPKADVTTYLTSPKITVPAGTYWVSAYFMTAGKTYPSSGKLLYGPSADPASQTAIIEFDENSVSQEWTLLKYQLTVDAESALYFTLEADLTGPIAEGKSWFVAMDNFRITKSEVFPPAAQINDVELNIYGAQGVYDFYGDTIYLASDSADLIVMGDYSFVDTVYFKNVSESIFDDFDGYYPAAIACRVNTTDNPLTLSYEFYAEGEYGNDSLACEHKVFHNYAGDHRAVVTNICPSDKYNMYFDLTGDVYFDKQTQQFAGYGERFCVTALDDENPHYAQLNGLMFMLYNYWIEEDHQTADSITISVYAENYDEATEEVSIGDCIGQVRMSYAEAFGENQYIVKTLTPVHVLFDEPINVYGTFYVFVESDTWDVASDEMCQFRLHEVGAGYTNPLSALWYHSNTSYVIYDGKKQSYTDAIGKLYAELNEEDVYYWAATGMFGADITFQGAEPEAVGIKRVVADSKLAIYPNPAKDVLYISNLASDASAVVTDLTGKQLMSLSHVQNSVSVAGLAQGVYFISIKDAEGVHTAKFVKE